MRRAVLTLVLSIGSCLAAGDVRAAILTTIAGGGPNNLPALAANLPNPHGLAFAGGHLYVGTVGRPRVFRIDPAGTLTVLAGNGLQGFSGDGGPAVEAMLDGPHSLAADAAGNVFIADTFQHRVRRVDAATGVITTIAGTGLAGFGGDGGPATAALLNTPFGVAVDAAGFVYVADSGNNRIRKILPQGTILTVAGHGQAISTGEGIPAVYAGLNSPHGVWADAAGNILIADTFGHRIRRVDAAGIITTVAGNGLQGFSGDGGPATSAQILLPWYVTADATGAIFIPDLNNRRIRRVDPATGIITTYAGNGGFGPSGDGGPATSASLGDPRQIAIDDAGNLLLTEFNYGHCVRRVDAATGRIETIAGNGSVGFAGEGVPAFDASLSVLRGSVLDPTGRYLDFADSGNDRIRRLDLETGIVRTLAGDGYRRFGGDGGDAVLASFNGPHGLARDAAGNLLIADTGNRRVRRVDALTGIVTTVAGTGSFGPSTDGVPATESTLLTPTDVALDAVGNLFIADQSDFRIRRVDAVSGFITTVAGNGDLGPPDESGKATQSPLSNPSGIDVSPGGDVYIADGTSVVLKVDAPSGQIRRVAGMIFEAGYSGDGGQATDARLAYPSDVTLDPAGSLLIADRCRVRRVDSGSGVISTIAGTGRLGLEGDGGPAVAADICAWSVALASPEVLYLTDATKRIRKVAPAGAEPPSVSLRVSPSLLWPPNHHLMAVHVDVTPIDPNAAVAFTFVSVTSSEPDDAPGGGDGATAGDIQGADPGTADVDFLLRAERDAGGQGRIYTITYLVTVVGGATSTATALVEAPLDLGGVVDPMVLSVEETTSGTLVTWETVPAALRYDVIRGRVGAISALADAIDLGAVVCVANGVTGTSTAGWEDASQPGPGEAFFYLAQFHGPLASTYGAPDAAAPRRPGTGVCR